MIFDTLGEGLQRGNILHDGGQLSHQQKPNRKQKHPTTNTHPISNIPAHIIHTVDDMLTKSNIKSNRENHSEECELHRCESTVV